MLRTRVIPILLMKNRGLYKGVKFRNYKYVGDPINAVKIFNEKCVDELVLLGYEETIQNSGIDFDYLKDVVREAFMPIGYGGGIRTREDARKLFALGVEKIIINTAFLENPQFASELADEFGSQSIVLSLDVRKSIFGYRVCYRHGTITSKYSPVDFASRMEKLGIGEVIINSIDRDGTRSGYDLSLIEDVAKRLKIPAIACGGANSIEDFMNAKQAGAHGCAAGAMFVYQGPLRAVLISYPKYDTLRAALKE